MRSDHDPSPSLSPSSPEDDLVVVRRADLDALVARVEALERRADPPSAATPSPPTPGRVTAGDGAVGRRRALVGLAGAAVAAGTAAIATSATPAAADNGNAITIGSVGNTGTLATGLAVTGDQAAYGFGVTDNGASSIGAFPALVGHARSQNFFVGVYGQAEQSSTGVWGSAAGTGSGVRGTSGSGSGGQFNTSAGLDGFAAVEASAASTASAGGTAVQASGSNQLFLVPNGRPSPPGDTLTARRGVLRWTQVDGALWACTGAGTPGTWRKVVGTGTAGAFHLLPVPKRVYDSRPGTTPTQGPKTPLSTTPRTIDLKHDASGVPAGATGALLTILLVNAADAAGNMTVWANDKPKPQANTMVWGGSAGRFTGTATTALDAQARIKVDASASTNVVIDVVGYFR